MGREVMSGGPMGFTHRLAKVVVHDTRGAVVDGEHTREPAERTPVEGSDNRSCRGGREEYVIRDGEGYVGLDGWWWWWWARG